MPFGEIVCGSPGSRKSTYCFGKHQLLTALGRPISIVNLDPANDNIPYPCAIDIVQLITLREVMNEHGLGPNGGLVYCMEYLEANFDWLEEKLAGLGEDAYVLFDLPGQVELSTVHGSLKKIVEKLTKTRFRVSELSLRVGNRLHLSLVTAGRCASLRRALCNGRVQVHLGSVAVSANDAPSRTPPHQRALQGRSRSAVRRSRCAPTSTRLAGSSRMTLREVEFNLDFYTEVQDLAYLENSLSASSPRFAALNMAIISLIEDYSLVGFETLAVEVRRSYSFLHTYTQLSFIGQGVDVASHAHDRPCNGVRFSSQA
jgi:hypothetical protein